MQITVIDRKTKKKEIEEIYGGKYLLFLYGDSLFNRIMGIVFSPICTFPCFSKCYGFFQKREKSKEKVKPFVEKYQVDALEFEKPLDQFTSFNDFFIRKLKKDARPIVTDPKIAIMPADGRYLVYNKIEECDYFYIKGKKFGLETFLQSKDLAKTYSGGSMVLVRLCPTDYHRFHFPFDCTPGSPSLINGPLYSVNPIALKRRLGILLENKRYITHLKNDLFGDVLFVEIGATNVGVVHQTYQAGSLYNKGDEKGFFSFGGSALAIIFKKDTIVLDQDLLEATKKGIEIKGLLGQSLGAAY